MHPSLTPPVPPWGRHSPIDSDLGGTLLWERRTAAQAGPDFLAPAPLWQLGSVSPPPSFGLPCPMGHLGVCHPHQASASPAPMGHLGRLSLPTMLGPPLPHGSPGECRSHQASASPAGAAARAAAASLLGPPRRGPAGRWLGAPSRWRTQGCMRIPPLGEAPACDQGAEGSGILVWPQPYYQLHLSFPQPGDGAWSWLF